MKKTALLTAATVFLLLAFLSCTNSNNPSSPGATATPTFTAAVVSPTFTSTLSYSGFVSVPGGTFTQTDGSFSFTHTVSAFSMGKYEVTYELWYTVYQWAISHGYVFANAGSEGNDGVPGAAPVTKFEPVTYVNWRDAMIWCNAYSQMVGLAFVYCSDAGFTTPIKDSTDGAYSISINTAAGSFDNPYVNWSAAGYRLPTEGEWEYTARYMDGASWTPYNYASGATADFNDTTATGLVAWYIFNSGNLSNAVGGKNANALGLYDMSGNAYEWCWDWDGAYPGTSADYRGPASGTFRKARGGSFKDVGGMMATGLRNNGGPYAEFTYTGFRLAKK